ncbi:hypothetical protein RBB50_010283 [Rhinocladiella similis]
MSRRRHGEPFRRTGCVTCKSRHKRCDEQKPRCGNCMRLDLECTPSELFRASHPRRERSKKHRTPSFSDFLLDDSVDIWDVDVSAESFCDAFDLVGDSLIVETVTPQLGRCQPSWAVTLAQPQASLQERYLLDHYIHRASVVLINVDGPLNPLRQVLVPRALISPTLMDALYAIAAYHVFVCNDDPDMKARSLAYYNSAASRLSCLIRDTAVLSSGQDLEILVLTTILLCKYEIISVGPNWRQHLRGVQTMLDVYRNDLSRKAPETLSYAKSFFSYHSCIAGITRTDESPCPSTFSDHDEPGHSARPHNDVDPYMGISGELISLLTSATETAMLDFSKDENLFSTMCTVIRIHERITNDATILETPSLPREHGDDTICHLRSIAVAYKNVLIAYLHIILEAVADGASSKASLFEYSRIQNLIALTKDEAISACIQATLSIPDDNPCSVGLVPLLFFVATETTSSTEFDIALKRLSAIFRTARLGNVGTALDLLAKMQRIKAVHWRQILKCCEWDLVVT